MAKDDDRIMLPPLPDRPPIYCYYDADVQKPRPEKDAESELLLTWRRAWWAQGFTPIIIGPAEAMGSSFYQEFQSMKLGKEVKADMMRWMAWETLEGGLLAQCTTFPMGRMEDDTLVAMRRGKFARLTRWKGLDNGLLGGKAEDIRKTLKSVMNKEGIEADGVKTVLETIKSQLIDAEDSSALSYYSPKVRASYGLGTLPAAAATNSTKPEKREDQDKAKNMQDLVLVINAHLHTTWQGIYKDGIEVLRPHPEHTWPMVQEAYGYANALVACPQTPKRDKCPPNIKQCTPCEGEKSRLKIKNTDAYANKSSVFTIGTVPHPWTFAVLVNMKEDIDVGFIRREAARDPWLTAVTKNILGDKVSAAARILSFKEAVAGEYAAAHALWLQAEIDTPTDLAWRFGFALPDVSGKDDNDKTHASSVEEAEVHARERRYIESAREVVAMKKSSQQTKTRASMEAWSMADAEAWHFAKAFLARRLVERLEWEKEEKKFAGGAGSEDGRSAWNRWSDLKEGAETGEDMEEW